MAHYPPPTNDLPIYSTTSFFHENQALTYQEAEKYFLRYPQAQGTQNLLNTNIAGVTTLMSDVIINDVKNAPVLATDIDGKIIAGTAANPLWDQIGNDIYNTNTGEVYINNDLNVLNDALINGTANITGDLNVDGNLNVNGTQTIINTQTIDLADNLIRINYGQTGTPPSSLRSGIEVERGDLTNYLFVFEESTDLFKIGEGVAGLQAVATRDDTMTANIVPYWNDVAKKFTSSNIDNTTLGYLSGTTSNIQTQLNAKFDKSGGLITGTTTIESPNPTLTIRNNSGGSGGSLYFGNSNHGIIQRTSNDIVFSNAYAGGQQATQGNFIFENGTTSSKTEKVRINGFGNVGINESDPQEKLHVDGNIRCDNLTAGEILASDSNKNIVSTGTPSSYLTGLTGNIQNQIDNIDSKLTYYEFSDRDTDPGPSGISFGPVQGSPQFMKINDNVDNGASSRFLDISMPSDTTNNQNSVVTFFRNSLGSGQKAIQVVGTNPSNPSTRQTFINLSAGTQPNYFLHNNVGINENSPQEKLHVNGNIRCDNLTTNRILASDGNKNIVSTGTPSSYLTGLTSNIQDQLNSKQDKVPNVGDTEIGYLEGATSNIQTQILYRARVYRANPNPSPNPVAWPKIIYGVVTSRTTSNPETVNFPSGFSFVNNTYAVITQIRLSSNTTDRITVYVINKTQTSFQFRTLDNNGPTQDLIDWIAIGA